MSGAWGSVALNGGAAIAALIWVVARRTPVRLSLRGIAGACLVATAVTTYSVAITYADVVRVVLLFYLAPAWSKVIEWAFMNQRWGWTSTCAVGLSLAGAYMVLGGEVSFDSIGFGDILAVLSGIAWAGGAALIFTSVRANAMSLTLVTALAATLLGIGFALLGGDAAMAGLGDWSAKPIGALGGAIYVLPILALTLWSAQRLSPAVISFLLTAEILSGVITGALFAGEPFGPLQAVGAVLILLAAAVEVVPAMRRRPA